jgi:hypothetical protein
VNPTFLKPRYNSHCFADIPATVTYLLTGQGQPALSSEVLGPFNKEYEAVVLLFVDAFGRRFYEQFKSHPALVHLTANGHVSQLTSQFPSTTAAHVTAIHTGLPPAQSGVYEWYYYEPKSDAVIAPLPFSFAGTERRETLRSTHLTPADLYPSQTLYQQLAAQDIKSYVFQHRSFATSTYSNYVSRGATLRPFYTLSQALVNLRSLLAQPESPVYYFLYFDAIDTISHWHGPTSPHLAAEIDSFLQILDTHFLKPLAGQLKDTLLILTADHGQVETDPATTLYLNLDSRFNGVTQYLKRNQKGDWLVPAGSARDFFLYIQPGQLDAAQAFLADRLEGRADVLKVTDLIAQGYFGPQPPSDVFLSRVGDLVILPYAGESVWWHESDKYEQRFYGHHGGLTPQEMEIPLLLYDFTE